MTEIVTVMEDAAQEWADKQQPANHRAAELLAMTANCHRRKNSRTFKAADFLSQKTSPETPGAEYVRLHLQLSTLC